MNLDEHKTKPISDSDLKELDEMGGVCTSFYPTLRARLRLAEAVVAAAKWQVRDHPEDTEAGLTDALAAYLEACKEKP